MVTIGPARRHIEEVGRCEERSVWSSSMKRSAINHSLTSISPVRSQFGCADHC